MFSWFKNKKKSIDELKLVMTLLVRDDSDVLEQNILFHKNSGVDYFIVTDHNSVDQTHSILKKYEALGWLTFIHETSEQYNQAEWVTKMARMAYDLYHADWVINNDADEFWWAASGSLKQELYSISESVGVVLVGRNNFVPLDLKIGEECLHRMIYRERQSKNALGDNLPPKACHRACSDVIVSMGNHDANGNKLKKKVYSKTIDILHYPLRSYKQFENKISKGGLALSKSNLPASLGATWRKQYEIYQAGKLQEEYLRQAYSPAQISEKLETGELIIDERLKHFLTNLELNSVDAK